MSHNLERVGYMPDVASFLRQAIGAQREIVVDDSSVLPEVSRMLDDLGCGQLGAKIASGGEHSVRLLDEDKVAKIGEPGKPHLIDGFINWIEYGLDILREEVPAHLPETQLHYVGLGNESACYVLVMDKVEGKVLAEIGDEELPLVAGSLLSILKANETIYSKHGICIDLSAAEELHHPTRPLSIRGIPRIVNPRYTHNLMATTNREGQLDGNVMITDPVMQPQDYQPGVLPGRFRHLCYLFKIGTPLMIRAQCRLLENLERQEM